jgi:hypothetical protein
VLVSEERGVIVKRIPRGDGETGTLRRAERDQTLPGKRTVKTRLGEGEYDTGRESRNEWSVRIVVSAGTVEEMMYRGIRGTMFRNANAEEQHTSWVSPPGQKVLPIALFRDESSTLSPIV